MRTRDLLSLTAAELTKAELEKPVFIPFGTLEAHGKHLPLGTDTMCAESIARRLAETLDGFVAPPLPYGITNSLFRYGVASQIPSRTYVELVEAILQNLIEGGFRKLVLVNGHGGNNEPLGEVVKKLAPRHKAFFVLIHWWMGIGDLTEAIYGRKGGHGGLEETAAILNCCPDAVRPELYRREDVSAYLPGYITFPNEGTILEEQPAEPIVDFDREKARLLLDQIVERFAAKLRHTFARLDQEFSHWLR